MFKNPFSFEGRIRRLEYGFSIIIICVVYTIIGFLMGAIIKNGGKPLGFLMFPLAIPIYWFKLAQAVKRSHDTGHTGWYVLIPFYGLYLLLAEGDVGPNKYGDDPKERANQGGFGSNPQNPSSWQHHNNPYNGTGFGGYNGGYNGANQPQNPSSWQHHNNPYNGTGFGGYNGGHNGANQPQNPSQGHYQSPQSLPQPKRGDGKDFDGNLYGKAK